MPPHTHNLMQIQFNEQNQSDMDLILGFFNKYNQINPKSTEIIHKKNRD